MVRTLSCINSNDKAVIHADIVIIPPAVQELLNLIRTEA